MNKEHNYSLTIEWTGNKGTGTANPRTYDRSHTISVEGKASILASADPMYRGDKTRHNPEELLLAALSSCHMLSYLFLCAMGGVVVTEYIDNATGIMMDSPDGGGQFTEATLHPVVTVSEEGMIDKANALHKDAAALCVIARSVNFPVHHHPTAKTPS